MFEVHNGDLSGGWADRVKGIMSAYAVSIVLKRELVIKIIRPCFLTEYLEPNEINWNIDLPNDLTIVKHQISWNWTYFQEILDKFLDEDQDKDIIAINSGIDNVFGIGLHPKYQQKIIEAGYRTEEFTNYKRLTFAKWYRKLFKFKPSLEIDYQKFYSELKPTQNHKIICTQVRIGGQRKDRRFDDLLFMNHSDTFKYWKFIRENLIFNKTTNTTLKDFKIFVTTDTLQVVDEAIKEFGDDKVVGTKDLGLNIAMFRETELSKCSDLRYLYIEFFLLGQCDMGVISNSGFGVFGLLNREENNYKDFFIYKSLNSNSEKIFRKFEDIIDSY